LPVVDTIAADYLDDVRFVAVAGKSSYEKAEDRAAELFGNLDWGLDDAVWDTYGVPYQPVTFLISWDNVIVDTWPGILDEGEIRSRLDSLAGRA
jgi:hypothetical protein